MITKTITSRSDLSNFFDINSLPKSSILNRQKLIKMANNGEDRPHRKTKLGKFLDNYTCKSSGSYCPKFDATIRRLAPNWFVSRTQVANKTKQKLIKIAESGKNKPHWKTKLYQDFKNYTYNRSPIYCQKFCRIIRSIAPSWLLSRKQISDQKKQELIKMAKNGVKRPKQKTKIGCSLSNYTRKSSEAYDPIFDKTIRKLAPSWF